MGTGSEPRRWTFFGSPKADQVTSTYYLEEGPEFRGSVEVVESRQPDERDEERTPDERCTCYRGGHACLIHGRSVREWKPDPRTVDAVVEALREAAADGATINVPEIEGYLRERFKPEGGEHDSDGL